MIFKHRMRLKTLYSLYNVIVCIIAWAPQNNIASSSLERNYFTGENNVINNEKEALFLQESIIQTWNYMRKYI